MESQLFYALAGYGKRHYKDLPPELLEEVQSWQVAKLLKYQVMPWQVDELPEYWVQRFLWFERVGNDVQDHKMKHPS